MDGIVTDEAPGIYLRGKRVPVVVYMNPDDHKALTSLCESWGLTRAYVIRQSLFTLMSKNGYYSSDSNKVKPKGVKKREKEKEKEKKSQVKAQSKSKNK